MQADLTVSSRLQPAGDSRQAVLAQKAARIVSTGRPETLHADHHLPKNRRRWLPLGAHRPDEKPGLEWEQMRATQCCLKASRCSASRCRCTVAWSSCLPESSCSSLELATAFLTLTLTSAPTHLVQATLPLLICQDVALDLGRWARSLADAADVGNVTLYRHVANRNGAKQDAILAVNTATT